MKALLVDPTLLKVLPVEVHPRHFVESANAHIGSDCYCLGGEFQNGDTILVDDEGLLKQVFYYFSIDGATPHPLAGRGLICGTDNEGETIDVQSNREEVEKLVKYYLRIGRRLIQMK